MRLIFRADGSSTIGLGHVVRTLALADMVGAGPTDCFVARTPPDAVRALVQAAGLQLVELPDQPYEQEAEFLATRFLQPADVVVLDSYHFDTRYQQQLKASGCRLVCIDDLRRGFFVADLIINHSPGVTPAMYEALPTTRFCLGPAYSLLRPPFLQHARPPQPPADVTSVLLCFGGADPLQLTARCLAALLPQPAIRRVGLLMGGASTASSEVAALREAYPETELEEFRGLGAEAMVQVLARYDAVVCPASTILIESLALGKPALTGYFVDNQRHLADYVHAHRQAYSVGDFTSLTATTLPAALQQGLQWLAHTHRQPYTGQLQPAQLRQELGALRQR